MDRIIKLFAVVFVIGVGTTAIFLKSQPLSVEENLILKNIEALASNEIDSDAGLGGGKIKCYGVIKDEDAGPYTVTKCSTCMDVKCSDYTDSAKCSK